ncbi:MAG: hypothetical protein A2Y40_02195 [Candidatus Margulisbacteria bacterium GWF2_35_9]|nr:MAG: hypothetical protein A2Y40_02195 [Candidatus Margulisbacteria bacterium GWF2_35_9]
MVQLAETLGTGEKVIRTIIKILIIISAFSYVFSSSDFFIEPAISFGLSYNDNIDKVSANAAVNGTAALLQTGLNFSHYLGPNLLYSGNIQYALNHFTNPNFGSLSNIYLNNGIYYDMTKTYNLGLNIGIDSFSDSINNNANYFSYAITPKISYEIFQATLIGLTATHTNTNYYKINSSTNEQKLGVYFSREIIPGMILSLGNYNLSSVSTISSSNYTGNQSSIVLEFEINSISNLYCSYSFSKLEYPQWSKSRVDSTSYFNLAYVQEIHTDFTLNLLYSYSKNHSTDSVNSYSQNIYQLFFECTPQSEPQANILFDLAFTLHQKKQYQDAIPLFETAISLDPTKTESYYLLSYCYLKTNQKRKAIQLLQNYPILNQDARLKKILEYLLSN